MTFFWWWLPLALKGPGKALGRLTKFYGACLSFIGLGQALRGLSKLLWGLAKLFARNKMLRYSRGAANGPLIQKCDITHGLHRMTSDPKILLVIQKGDASLTADAKAKWFFRCLDFRFVSKQTWLFSVFLKKIGKKCSHFFPTICAGWTFADHCLQMKNLSFLVLKTKIRMVMRAANQKWFLI